MINVWHSFLNIYVIVFRKKMSRLMKQILR